MLGHAEAVDLSTRRETVDDARNPGFRWLEQGAGEPVLLLHGLMGQMHHWDTVIEGLAPLCRPMALALPIFDPALRDASIAGLSDHVLRFLDALDIPRAVIGGNSLGGHVALALTMAHRDRVSGLVLTGSSGLFERGFTRGVPRQPTGEYVRQKMEEALFDRSLVTDAWVESVRSVLTTPAGSLRVVRFARDARRCNVADRLRAIEVPTLLVWGREDRITPPEAAERFRAMMPDAQLTYLARCGHTAMLERPGAFTEVVARWLETTRERRMRFVAQLGGVR
jgi:pimeloyl-ACP methyl ester carboxylesterase